MASKSLPSCKIEAIGRGRVNSSAHIIRTTSFVAIELSRYAFESLRSDKEFHLCRGRRKGETSSFAKATEDKSSRDREDVARSSEAHEDLGPSSILFLSPVSKQPSFSTIKRLEHEYSLRDELHPDWAIRPLALTRQDGRTVLVFEDPGSELLERLLGQPMEPLMFLRLAISLAAGLRMLHSRGLIHKDIKPANIFVDTLTRKIWLTGFGISSRLTREKQALEPPETIAGTLAYMAPEQTGRMNRSIDSRSDLYSLGVTLYQMLTGCLPFTASDPMEWVHCHIARQPTPPVDLVANVPASVSAIIMKLLAKTAEERYQTAAGVEADLRRCLDEYLSSSGVTGVQDKIPEFPLGQHDTPNRLFIPEKLYGRERE
ncbi:MAG: serine/threonine protein kinase, partial [Verrucomicrobia bacterium]|nr:serine/threonine protein kinase [Verrucomicrobiota bacterium]